MKINYFILSICFIALGMTGCDEENSRQLTGITVNKNKVSIDADAVTSVIPFPLPWDAEVREKFTWTSENRDVARVNSKGEILGVDPGETNIICHYGNFTATVHVTVNPLVSLSENIKNMNAKGYWEFENTSNLTEKITGADLVFVEDNKTISSIEGPRSDNRAIRIPWDSKNKGATGTFVKCLHGFTPQAGEEKINKYTILWDIRLPNEAGMPETGYYSLMSTRTLDNSQDQDFAIKRAGNIGIGALGYTPDNTISKGKWYRIILSAEAGKSFTYYVDGKKVYDGNAAAGDAKIDGRFSLLPEGVLFFSDEDGDDSTIDASAIAIWDRALSETEISKLGSVRQTVVFVE